MQTILVCDDDKEIVEAIQIYLEQEGYEVLTAYDGMQALQQIRQNHIDLLVIDEIGVQTESKYEKVIINQIVDRRSSSKRPTGMLTNSNMEEMTKLLGERVMDRMRLGNSLWVIFNWDSYRSRVTGKEY